MSTTNHDNTTRSTLQEVQEHLGWQKLCAKYRLAPEDVAVLLDRSAVNPLLAEELMTLVLEEYRSMGSFADPNNLEKKVHAIMKKFTDNAERETPYADIPVLEVSGHGAEAYRNAVAGAEPSSSTSFYTNNLTQEEQERAKQGLCIWQTAYGLPHNEYCPEKATQGLVCNEHAELAVKAAQVVSSEIDIFVGMGGGRYACLVVQTEPEIEELGEVFLPKPVFDTPAKARDIFRSLSQEEFEALPRPSSERIQQLLDEGSPYRKE